MKIKLDTGAYAPERAHYTDAGLDIKSPADCYIPANGAVVIRTGVHVQLPEGTVGILMSKSGLNIKWGITSEGVIDEGYSGEIRVKLYNHGAIGYPIHKGDKITQLLVMPVLYEDVCIVDEIASGDRGEEGFGSTGK